MDEPTDRTKVNADKTFLGLADLVTLFLEMINTYTLMNENSEAGKLMQVSYENFNNQSFDLKYFF